MSMLSSIQIRQFIMNIENVDSLKLLKVLEILNSMQADNTIDQHELRLLAAVTSELNKRTSK